MTANTARLRWTACAHFAGLEPPAYASAEAAGMDLRAACPEETSVVLSSHARVRVPTGLCLSIPDGFEGQIRSRSGLALRHGLVVLNSPGTIDSDYRGEIQVLLINLGNEPVRVLRGERIAQLVIAPIARAVLEHVAQLPATGRGQSGFGSTGRR